MEETLVEELLEARRGCATDKDIAMDGEPKKPLQLDFLENICC